MVLAEGQLSLGTVFLAAQPHGQCCCQVLALNAVRRASAVATLSAALVVVSFAVRFHPVLFGSSGLGLVNGRDRSAMLPRIRVPVPS